MCHSCLQKYFKAREVWVNDQMIAHKAVIDYHNGLRVSEASKRNKLRILYYMIHGISQHVDH